MYCVCVCVCYSCNFSQHRYFIYIYYVIIVINYKKVQSTLSLGREKSRQIKPETGRDTALFSSVQVYWSVSN